MYKSTSNSQNKVDILLCYGFAFSEADPLYGEAAVP